MCKGKGKKPQSPHHTKGQAFSLAFPLPPFRSFCAPKVSPPSVSPAGTAARGPGGEESRARLGSARPRPSPHCALDELVSCDAGWPNKTGITCSTAPVSSSSLQLSSSERQSPNRYSFLPLEKEELKVCKYALKQRAPPPIHPAPWKITVLRCARSAFMSLPVNLVFP